VHALKFSGWTGLSTVMGNLMLQSALNLARGATCTLVPVPLSRARLRERGYNQSELLAEGLGMAVGWPIQHHLVRRSSGRQQARSTRRDRAGNVEQAFEPAGIDEAGAEHRRPLPVLLVDDVVTTGSTARACAAALPESDFDCRGIVVFARTLRHGDEW